MTVGTNGLQTNLYIYFWTEKHTRETLAARFGPRFFVWAVLVKRCRLLKGERSSEPDRDAIVFQLGTFDLIKATQDSADKTTSGPNPPTSPAWINPSCGRGGRGGGHKLPKVSQNQLSSGSDAEPRLAALAAPCSAVCRGLTSLPVVVVVVGGEPRNSRRWSGLVRIRGPGSGARGLDVEQLPRRRK